MRLQVFNGFRHLVAEIEVRQVSRGDRVTLPVEHGVVTLLVEEVAPLGIGVIVKKQDLRRLRRAGLIREIGHGTETRH